MTKLSILATAACLAMAFSAPFAVAQTPPEHPKIVMPDHSMRASMLIGKKVLDEQNGELGTVVEIMVKNGAVEPKAIVAILDLNALATRHVAVPLSRLKVQDDKVMMPGVTKKMLVAMPLYDYEGDGRSH
nr:PRC-barrel domain-containing protein [uncultured Rhodopila sp.]